MKNAFLLRVAKDMGFADAEEFYTQIANGGTLVNKAANALFALYDEEQSQESKKKENTVENLTGATKPKRQKDKTKANLGVVVEGMDDLMLRMSKCCNPVPGDEIIGYITKGRGISVYRTDCVNIISLALDERDWLINVEWDTRKGTSYEADITVVAEDRKGLFSDLSKVCESMDVHISGVNTKKSGEGELTIILTLSDRDRKSVV